MIQTSRCYTVGEGREMDVREQIENLAYLAVSQPWSGDNVGRNQRVYCGLLRRVANTGWRSLEVVTDLSSLSVEAGLGSSGRTVREALSDLVEAGVVDFTVGDQWRKADGDIVKGMASEITLVSREAKGRYPVDQLPDPTLEVFDSDQAGSNGYLLVSRVKFEGGSEVLTGDDLRTYGTAELSRLTGIPLATVKRVAPKLCAMALAYKEGSRYTFYELDRISSRGEFGTAQSDRRRSKIAARRQAQWLDDGDPVSPEVVTSAERYLRDFDSPNDDEQVRQASRETDRPNWVLTKSTSTGLRH
jgi:hypothetical protein